MDGMQMYFNQLIDDIRESTANRERNTARYFVPIPGEVPEHLQRPPAEKEKKAWQWFNLSLTAFPPAEKWNEYQLLYLCVSLRQLFEHYNLLVELPHRMPYEQVYTFLLKALDMPTPCNPHDDTVDMISFCDCEEATCPFGEHCGMTDGYYCDNWAPGQPWNGFVELEEMKKKIEDQ
jgi:hypothetical protein